MAATAATAATTTKFIHRRGSGSRSGPEPSSPARVGTTGTEDCGAGTEDCGAGTGRCGAGTDAGSLTGSGAGRLAWACDQSSRHCFSVSERSCPSRSTASTRTNSQAVSQLGSVRPRAAAASDDFDAAAPSRAAISA